MKTTDTLQFVPPGFKYCNNLLPNGKTCTRWVKIGYERCYRCYQRLRRAESEWDDDEEADRG